MKSPRLLVLLGVLGVLGGCSTLRPVNPHHRGFLDRDAGETDRGSFGPDYAVRADELGSAERGGGHAVEVSPVALRWPLARVAVTSQFGGRGRNSHEGVDLRAPRGTPVYAAQSGTVVYAGSRLRGYGNLVVIRHAMGVSTVYAHNSRLLVRTGQVVRQGQKISLSGNTGHSSGPHLHFEVRNGSAALDPVESMPKFTDTAVASAARAVPPPTAPMRRPAAVARATARPKHRPVRVVKSRGGHKRRVSQASRPPAGTQLASD